MDFVSESTITAGPVNVVWNKAPVSIDALVVAKREIERIFNAAKHSKLAWNHDQTIIEAVKPILEMLGWEGLIQYNFLSNNHPLYHADIRLGNNFRDSRLVEVKPFGKNLRKSEGRKDFYNPLDQIIRYLNDSSLTMGILTNAVDWFLFKKSSLDIATLTDAKFICVRFNIIDFFNDTDRFSLFLGLFSERSSTDWCDPSCVECNTALDIRHREGPIRSSRVIFANFSNRPTGTDRVTMDLNSYFDPYRSV